METVLSAKNCNFKIANDTFAKRNSAHSTHVRTGPHHFLNINTGKTRSIEKRFGTKTGEAFL